MSRLERIVREIGGTLYDNGRRALVPGPGHSPRDRSVSLLESRDGRVLVYCFSPNDDVRVVRAWLADRGIVAHASSPGALAPLRSDGQARARRLWEEASPIAGTPAERYLQTRRVCAPQDHGALRFHARATSLEDRRRRPALLASIRDRAGRVQGVEIALLAPGGGARADVATPRRIVGRLTGGAVRLQQADASLIVAEGVITALSASRALRLPAWAALSAHSLARFDPPMCVRRLVVAADNDAAGLAAAEQLRCRLRSRLTIELALPPGRCNDWNDWLCRNGAVG